MTPLIPFSYQDRPVRVVTIDDEPWFVATDITPVLGYQHGPSAIRRLEDDEHQQIAYSLVDPTVRPGFGPQTVTVETTKVTGKGQRYFIDRYLAKEGAAA